MVHIPARRLIALALSVALISAPALAQIPPQLPVATSVGSSDLITIWQSNKSKTAVPSLIVAGGGGATSFSGGSTGFSFNDVGGAVTMNGVANAISGGTGLSSTPTNGQIDIGNGTGFTRTTLTGGTDITVANGSGSISVGLTNNATTVNGVSCVLGGTCTITAAAALAPGTTTITGGTSGDIEYNNAGILGEKAVTGTGSVVLATSPTIVSPTVTGSFTATGLVTNADLVNQSTTVNGVTCTLGATCTISASAGTITPGTTTVASGTSNGLLYDNAGVLGNLATANNGVLVTSSGGVPSVSTTLPSGLAMQTPASINLANATALPATALTGTLQAAQFPALTGDVTTTAGALPTTVSQVNGHAAATITAQGNTVTGSGSIVLATAPSITNANLNTPSAINLSNGSSLPITAINGFGTGVATALATNVGSTGSFVVNGGALGTPSSGVGTNLTGTASGLTAGAVPLSGITGTGSGFATAAAQAVNTSSGFVTGSGLGTAGALLSANNLSDVASKATTLANIGQNPNINFISGAHPNVSTDSSGAFSTAMTNSTNNGGGITEVPAGNSYCFTATANMQKASMLEGSLPVPQNDSTSPLMVGSRLQACANVASLLTQTTITSLLHSPNIDAMVLDGNKGSYTATNLLNWSPVNAYVTKSQFVNGSGNCIYHQRNATAAWIDWYENNTIGGCTGTGILDQGTDGRIALNYISNNGVNIGMYSTGAYQILGNQIELAGTDGLDIGWDGTYAFGSHSITANNFTQNTTWDINWINPGTTYVAEDAVVANNFHYSAGLNIGQNITGGLVAADQFAQSQKAQDIAFNGSSNTGWQIIGTNHSLSPSARFSNLPSDTQVISGGTGGAWNRLQSLIVTPSTNNVPNTYTGGAQSQFYGGSTVLGASNVISRFGNSYNNASYDPALLIGSTNGNAPFIDVVNGEQASAAGFSFQYRHSNVWSINSAGTLMTVSQPFAATSTTAFGSTGQATVDASGNIATTGTFTQNGTGTSRIGSSSGGNIQFVPGTPGGSNPAGDVGIYDSAGNRAGYMGYQEIIGGNNFLRLGYGTYVGWSLDGSVAMPNLTSDATLTDRTACLTTIGLMYYGSGTLGICLGTSSERYKHGLATLQPGLEDLMKLHPKRGFLNADHGDPTKPYYWITAEDGYQAFPELTGLDTQGRPNTFDLLGLVPVMVNGIQDVVDITDDLKAANDNTAATVAKLEARMDAQDRKIAALEAKVARLSHHPKHRKAV